MKRLRITIEGPDHSGKTQIRKAVVEELKKMGKTYQVYDPICKYKPEQVDFKEAEAIIMVKIKNEKTVI